MVVRPDCQASFSHDARRFTGCTNERSSDAGFCSLIIGGGDKLQLSVTRQLYLKNQNLSAVHGSGGEAQIRSGDACTVTSGPSLPSSLGDLPIRWRHKKCFTTTIDRRLNRHLRNVVSVKLRLSCCSGLETVFTNEMRHLIVFSLLHRSIPRMAPTLPAVAALT